MKKLQEYHSATVHHYAARTHLRRLAKTPGSETLVENFEQVYAILLEKQKNLEEKIEVRIDANDDIDYYDTILDNNVKMCSFEAKSYDVKSGTAPVYNLLFPEGGYSSITRMNKIEEVTEVEALAGRIENLGNEHPLFTFAATLLALTTDSKKAIENFRQAEEEVNKATAELEIAKSNLREKYRDNYLQACSKLGDNKAESLFTNSF